METAAPRRVPPAVCRQPTASTAAQPHPGVSETGQGAGGAICARGAGSGARPAASKWRVVPRATPDAIFGIASAYRVDKSADKVSVVIGAYRRGDGTPWVLPSVREAERRVLNADHGHEYLPIDGHRGFCKAAAQLLYGPACVAVAEKRLVSTQVLSGTGGLRVGMEFCKRFLAPGTLVLLPDPTWPNHMGICAHAGLEYRHYRYLHKTAPSLDLAAMVEDLRAAPEGSIVVLHACAHNPTGVDPTRDEWREVAAVCEERGHLPFFDVAYQGFASGDVDADAWAVRMFVDRGLHVCASQSFSKNFGLYGERAGCLTFVTDSPEEAASVRSQVNSIIRAMYSNPPSYGARLVHTVLSDPELAAQWRLDCRAMAERIHSMRLALRDRLEAHGAGGGAQDWSHITSQIGMFSYTGLTDRQCERLRVEHHIYVAGNGRVSMAAVTPANVDALARAILAVVGAAGDAAAAAAADVAVIDVSAGADAAPPSLAVVVTPADGGGVCARTPALARKVTSGLGGATASDAGADANPKARARATAAVQRPYALSKL